MKPERELTMVVVEPKMILSQMFTWTASSQPDWWMCFCLLQFICDCKCLPTPGYFPYLLADRCTVITGSHISLLIKSICLSRTAQLLFLYSHMLPCSAWWMNTTRTHINHFYFIFFFIIWTLIVDRSNNHILKNIYRMFKNFRWSKTFFK